MVRHQFLGIVVVVLSLVVFGCSEDENKAPKPHADQDFDAISEQEYFEESVSGDGDEIVEVETDKLEYEINEGLDLEESISEVEDTVEQAEEFEQEESEPEPACLCNEVNECCDGCNPINEGGECTGENLCYTSFKCENGLCVGDVQKDCDDGNPCTVDLCNEDDGSCYYEPAEAGTPCSADGLSCTADVCDGTGACVHNPLNPGEHCGESRICQVNALCECAADVWGDYLNTEPVVTYSEGFGDCSSPLVWLNAKKLKFESGNQTQVRVFALAKFGVMSNYLFDIDVINNTFNRSWGGNRIAAALESFEIGDLKNIWPFRADNDIYLFWASDVLEDIMSINGRLAVHKIGNTLTNNEVDGETIFEITEPGTRVDDVLFFKKGGGYYLYVLLNNKLKVFYTTTPEDASSYQGTSQFDLNSDTDKKFISFRQIPDTPNHLLVFVERRASQNEQFTKVHWLNISDPASPIWLVNSAYEINDFCKNFDVIETTKFGVVFYCLNNSLTLKFYNLNFENYTLEEVYSADLSSISESLTTDNFYTAAYLNDVFYLATYQSTPQTRSDLFVVALTNEGVELVGSTVDKDVNIDVLSYIVLLPFELEGDVYLCEGFGVRCNFNTDDTMVFVKFNTNACY